MRLNRGTIILLLVSLVVIVGAVVISNNQATQSAIPSPTPEGGGPLFTDLSADEIISLAVRNNQTGEFARLAREGGNASGSWEVSGLESSADNVVDQGAADAIIEAIPDLASVSSFEAESFDEFGLAEPHYTIEIDPGGESLHVILVGSRNPPGNRYYVMTRQVEASVMEATEEAQVGGGTVLLVPTTALDKLINLLTSPPYQPTATPLPTATATLN